MLFGLILLLLVLVNGYFSAAEIAMVSVKKFKIQQDVDKGSKKARLLMDYLKDPDEYLSSIQVGITLVGMIEGLYGGEVLKAWLEPRFINWGMSAWLANISSIVLGIGFITYFTIVIGELLPKTIALQIPQKIALMIVPSFRIFTFFAYPFVKLLTGSTHLMVRFLKIQKPESQKLTEPDLRNLLSLAYRQGTLEKTKYELHENIFDFFDQTVEKIMTPLEKVTRIDESMSSETVEAILRKTSHNYFPVVGQGQQIVGFLSAKDFFKDPEKPIKAITQPACTLLGKQKASDLLQKFKEKNKNFGIVVTETGAMAGIVTMHDIAEELIGEIP